MAVSVATSEEPSQRAESNGNGRWHDRAEDPNLARRRTVPLPGLSSGGGVRSARHGWGDPRMRSVFRSASELEQRSDWPHRAKWNVLSVTVLDGSDHIELPFQQSSWVRAALKARMNAVAQVPARFVIRRTPESDPVPLPPTHPLARLLARPSGSLTTSDLLAQDLANVALDGDSFWFLRSATGGPFAADTLRDPIREVPSEILPVRGAWVQADIDEVRRVAGWRFKLRTGAWSPTFPVGAVIQFRDYNPNDPARGYGDVQALMPELDMAWAAMRYNAAVLQNGDPGCYIVYPDDLSQDEVDRRQADADEQFQAEDAGRHKVLGGGPEVIPSTLTPKDAAYRDLMAEVRMSTLAVLGCPAPVVSIFDDASDNDVKTAVELFWKGGNGILAHTSKTEVRINADICDRLEIPGTEGVRFEFDLSNVEALMFDHEKRIEAARELAKAGTGVAQNEAFKLCRVRGGESALGDRAIAAPGTIGFDKIDEAQAAAKPTVVAQPAGAKKVAASELSAEERHALLEQERKATFNASEPLAAGVEGWLARYQKAQTAKIDAFARGERQIVLETREDEKSPLELTVSDLEILDLSQKAWAEELQDIVLPHLEEIVLAGARQEWSKLGRLGSLLAKNDPRQVESLLRQAINLSEDVTATTSLRVRESILRALKEGELVAPSSLRAHIKRALPEIQGNVAKAFKNNDQRAQAISRTETGEARNRGKFEQMQRAGVAWKQWLDSDDTAVREEHVLLDGQIVPLAQPFSNGLMYPHHRAPGTSAGSRINCRCSFRAVFTQPTT